VFVFLAAVAGHAAAAAEVPGGDNRGQGGPGAHGGDTQVTDPLPQGPGGVRAAAEVHHGGGTQPGDQFPTGEAGWVGGTHTVQ